MDAGALESAVERVLAECPGGIEEQARLQRLRADPATDLPPGRASSAPVSFRVHFVLFHVL